MATYTGDGKRLDERDQVIGRKGSGLGPTISFKEACTKYGWTSGKLQAMLRREGAPQPQIRTLGTGGTKAYFKPTNTYYNKAEFIKWVNTLPIEEIPNGR